MKAIRCDLPSFEQIEIHPMADLHIGDSMSDYKLIMDRIEHIKNTPNAYCILGGDLMDTAIANSVGDTYGANLKPNTHLPVVMKNSFFRVSGANSSVAQVEKLFVNGASALNYGGYGDAQNFKPNSKSNPVIYLSGVKRGMWAKL